MQFKGFSYPADVPSYPSHVDVLQYITSYAEHFKVDEVICLSSSVTNVYKSKRNDSVWRVCVSSLERGEYEEEVDRLVVCNGHFSEPFCAPLKGIANFKGTIVHSKSYRTPEGYAGKVRCFLVVFQVIRF
jgi:cation diffusion facilitator CzcD-associated flavoprotein CzcO